MTAVVVELGERVDPGPLMAFEFGYVGGDGVESGCRWTRLGQVASAATIWAGCSLTLSITPR